MNATAYSTVGIHFGLGFDKSKLPEGWTLEESEKDWSRGISTDGKRYFLSPTKAFREIETGRIDTKNGIIEL